MNKIIPLILLGLPFAAAAQTASEEPAVKLINTADSVHASATLHENAPHLNNVPDVPRFALMGKDRNFYLGVGVNVKAVAETDFGNVIGNDNMFITSAIPMTQAPGNGSRFRLSAQQSNIFLNVVAMPDNKNKVGAYVSVNFLGDGYAPNLDLAYLKWRGLTAGYTYSLFTDATASPATIDYEGPNAFACMIHGTAMYEQAFGKDGLWKVGIGIDMPSESYTLATNTATVSQRVPDIPFYIQRSWAKGAGRLRLSGIVRNLYYRDLAANKNVDRIGWGVKASGTTPIVGGLSAIYQAVYGKGIASYIQDLTGTGMDLTPDPSNSGRLKPVEAWGAFGTLQYQFSPSVFASATYSHVRTYDASFADSTHRWKNGYKYAQYVAANVFWNVSPIVQVGAEYLYGRRVDFSGVQAHDNRIEAMVQVSF